MDKNSWLFDILDIEVLGEIGPKRLVNLSLDAIENRFKDENEKNLLKCALCPNMCEFACPVLVADGRETISPSRKARLGYFYSKEKLEAEELGKNLYYCLSCDGCKENCPMDLSVCDMLIPVREKIKEESTPPQEIRDIGDKLEKNQTIYDEIKNSESDGLKTGNGEILYFRSCVARKEDPELIKNTLEVLKKTGSDVQTLDEEICCGAPAKSLGFKDKFSEIAEKNRKNMNNTGAEKIVCSCPTCTYTLREIYPEEGYEIEPDIQHISEHLAENIGEDTELELSDPIDATYHDPCTLARRLEVIEEPREILKSIKNLNLTEPYLSKKDTNCCGRGGTLKFVDEELSKEIAKNRVQHLSDWGDTIITSCQSCKMSLQNVADEEDVINLSEIVLKALK